MTPPEVDLTDRAHHFDFGRNWAEFSQLIDQHKLKLAIESIHRLVPDISGKSFLDIGSGSGLFSAAALHLRASRVHAIDIDEHSVETTRRVLTEFAGEDGWTAEKASVFDLSPEKTGLFNVVYSWGVLHHTGDMWRAIDCAAALVAPRGTFTFALYESTPLCGAWRVEKRLYMRAGKRTQRFLCGTYKFAYFAARLASGHGWKKGMPRGMDVDHDIHDWMGGYPYESTNREQVRAHMQRLGFEPVRELPVKVHLAGLFGTGCSEYVYRRTG